MGRLNRWIYRDHAAEVTPAWMYKESVRLANISIWERPVDHLRSFYPCGKAKGSGVLKHDYVVIKLTYGYESFVVEKIAQRQKCGILNCKYAKFRSGGPVRGAKCREIVATWSLWQH